jgi:very-short-patch-repair endonuclease
MIILFILAGIVVLALVAAGLYAMVTGGAEGGNVEKIKAMYQYNAKKFLLTPSEHQFYDALGQAVGKDYRIFAQVHLPTIVDHKVVGQNWKAAFSHINGKSVDFVLCDKDNISPLLAIELDDKSHERPDRIERDTEVERVLKQAGVPLLRIENNGQFDPAVIASHVRAALGQK